MENVKGRLDTLDWNENVYYVYFGKDKAVGTENLNKIECQTC